MPESVHLAWGLLLQLLEAIIRLRCVLELAGTMVQGAQGVWVAASRVP